jgi:predicted LPLAT superfamily acyltransferase
LSARAGKGWAERGETGGATALRALLWLVLRLGPRRSLLALLPVTAGFLLFSRDARAASRDFLGRALGRPARLRDVARHFHNFAGTLIDRAFLLSGRLGGFDIATKGLEHVAAVLASGRGCVLLGAHLGSFEVLRSLARHSPAPVRPLMYRRNAGPLTALLDRLAPDIRDSVIDIGEPASMLRARECVARGEIVGILADRAPRGERQVEVDFLGSPAGFPAGPFILAASLAAPVVLFYGVRLGPCRYAIRFEPFAEGLELRRASRAADLHDLVSRYAAALDAACRAHPFNWFNFFPFWTSGRT